MGVVVSVEQVEDVEKEGSGVGNQTAETAALDIRPELSKLVHFQ